MVWLKTSVHFVIEFVLHVVLYYFRKMVQQLSTSSNSNQTTTADLWARKKVNNTHSLRVSSLCLLSPCLLRHWLLFENIDQL